MATSQPIHKTSLIPLEDFQPGGLNQFSHTQEEISEVIIKHLSRKKQELTPRQLEGIARFKYDGSWNLGQPDNLRDLKKFFDIFNDVFFNGVLTGWCQIEILKDKCAFQRLGFDSLGHCNTDYPGWRRDPRYQIERPSICIVINGQDSKTERPATEKNSTVSLSSGARNASCGILTIQLLLPLRLQTEILTG